MIVFCPLLVISQNIEYAKKTVDTLTSEYFAGRSIIENGEKKAANFIANEFKKNKLKQFNISYFQEFKFPINTFPNAIDVTFNTIKFNVGKDFIVDASSGKIDGTYKLICYNKKNIPSPKTLVKLKKKNFFKNKFIVLDKKEFQQDNLSYNELKTNVVNAAGIIYIEDKLTHHLSGNPLNYVVIHVKREALKKEYKTITIKIDQHLVKTYQSQNVIGFIKGTVYPDSFIVLSAHYDHLGKMGKNVYFPGANDNASGVAMLLNFAEHYSKNPAKKSIIFIAFGAEEAGLIGSKHFIENPTFSLNKINFVFNMDLMGTGSKGATIVNGKIFKKQYELLTTINSKHNYLLEIKKRGKAANSDHYWFSEKGIPAFFMYLMGGINAYHDIYDISETLPLTKYEETFRLIRDFINEL